MKRKSKLFFFVVLGLMLALVILPKAQSEAFADGINIALNPSRTGFPNPLESNNGWGCCSDKWAMIDGAIAAPAWYYGFAWGGGVVGYNGESCGWKQATINFGEPKTFNRTVTYHHGREHVPTDYKIQYWNGATWVDALSVTGNTRCQDGAIDNCPLDDSFSPVTGSKARYTFYQNCEITNNTDWRWIEHGWIREFEIYSFTDTNQPPIAEAGGPYTVDWGVALTLDGSGSTDPDNNIILYEWDLNADGIYDVTGVTTTTSFTQVGDHLATLRVTDAGGLSATDTARVTVTDPTLPAIISTISGVLGNNDWYISNVTVSWNVSDPESGIASSDGCDTTMLAADTTGDTLTCSATNGAGLINSVSVTIPIDKTAPTITASISPALPASGWWNIASGAPTVSFACNDATSGMAGPCPAAYTFPEGENQSYSQTVYDNAGNSASDGISNIDVDLIAPTLTWNSLIKDGDSFYFGSVPSEPTCTALDSLSGLDGSCAVSGYATAVGSHTLIATAKDNAGNQLTETRSYSVLGWILRGFYQPVDMNGVYNIAKNGSTVPFKFEIFAGTTELIDIAYIKSITSAPASCTTSATTDDIELTATGGTSLRYDAAAGQFVYNWKTPNTAGKCYRVTMMTIDGSTLVAYFKLK